MQFSDLAVNTSAAIVVTTQVATFPTEFADMLAQQPQLNRHYLIVHNTEQKTIPIELVRDFKQSTAFSVGERERQEIILLWAELLSLPAQQALLKLLEEPPSRIRFWLVTDQPQALLGTIQSRCVRLVIESIASETAAGKEQSTARRGVTLDAIATANYSQLISWAATPKDRTEAVSWCSELLGHCRSSNQTTSYKQQQALMVALEQLQQNANVKLVLEHCFFQMKVNS